MAIGVARGKLGIARKQPLGSTSAFKRDYKRTKANLLYHTLPPEGQPAHLKILLNNYYTLSSSIILADDLPPETVKKLKWLRYPQLPATLIGRLARDSAFRGQRIGELLLMDALKRALKAEIASLAVIVDAKDARARQFYTDI